MDCHKALTALSFTSGAALFIDDCVIENFVDHTIDFVPTESLEAARPHRLYVRNTRAANSTNGAGIHIKPVAGGKAIVEIENCSLSNNNHEVLAEDGTKFDRNSATGDVARYHNC